MVDRPIDMPPDPEQAPAVRLIRGAYSGDLEAIAQAIADGADVNALDPETGLAPLHIAVGLNDLATSRYLIEECEAAFFPDRFGRHPSLVAVECRVGEKLADYVVEQEARAAGHQLPPDRFGQPLGKRD